MRPRVALISLLAGAVGACAIDTSAPPRLSYAPPQEDAALPGPAAAGQPAGLIWNQLLDRLIQSPLEVDLADPARGIVVARYSGDPAPYVTCGFILVERGGEVEEVPASGEASFERVVQGRRLELNRGLNLDARLVVKVQPEGDGAAVETTSNYVLTKTVVAQNVAGWPRGRAQEVVSFSSGGRGEFSKGTVCQANGALERTVLDVLPRATVQAGGEVTAAIGAPAAGSGPAERPQVVESVAPAPDTRSAESSVPESDTPRAESAAPAPDTPTAESSGSAPDAEMAESAVPALDMLIAESAPPAPGAETAQGSAPAPEEETSAGPDPAPPSEAAAAEPEPDIVQAELPDQAALAVPDQTGQKVPYECPIDDRTFCDVLELTDPYRRANQERDLGLALDALEADNPLLEGSGLGVDISLPNYDSYLAVSYFLKDGTVRHVLPGAGRRWPANAREFVPGFGLDDRQSVEMVVALASDVPVFPSPRPSSEAAEQYLSDLRQRLAELRDGGAAARIAASLIVITPA